MPEDGPENSKTSLEGPENSKTTFETVDTIKRSDDSHEQQLDDEVLTVSDTENKGVYLDSDPVDETKEEFMEDFDPIDVETLDDINEATAELLQQRIDDDCGDNEYVKGLWYRQFYNQTLTKKEQKIRNKNPAKVGVKKIKKKTKKKRKKAKAIATDKEKEASGIIEESNKALFATGEKDVLEEYDETSDKKIDLKVDENEIEEKSPSIDGEDQMSIKSSSELAPLKNTAQFLVSHPRTCILLLSSWENGSGKMK